MTYFKVDNVQRSKGQSVVAAAAYRAGKKLKDDRTGEIKDYTKKRGVEFETMIFSPGVKPISRDKLWNIAEQREKRKDAVLAREYKLAFPYELNFDERKNLVLVFGKILTNRYGVAVDVSLHKPNPQGDERNFHAHVLTTTRQYGNEGLKEKTRILDDLKTGVDEVTQLRKIWFACVNDSLEKAGIDERVDPRSYEEQGLEKMPTIHLGAGATALERKGIKTDRGNINRHIQKWNSMLKTENEKRSIEARTWAKNKIETEIQMRRKIFEGDPFDQGLQPSGLAPGPAHFVTENPAMKG